MDLMRELQEYIKEASENLYRVRTTGKADGNMPFAAGIKYVLSLLSDIEDGKVFIIGNGGSAGIASEVSNRIWKFCNTPSSTFNDPVILTSSANDFGVEYMFSKPLTVSITKRDILIAISSSGQSKNILNGAMTAREIGAGVVTLSGFKNNNPLRKMGDINFYLGSENYRHVERTHLFILDCVIDMFLKIKEAK